jgi:GWxTD domain-containing protein
MNRSTVKYLYFLPLIIIIISIVHSCKTPEPVFDPKDISYIYNPLKNPFNPRYNISNQSDQSSVLAIKLFTSDLFFTEANPRGVPMALMFLSVNLYNISRGKILTDTAYINLDIIKDEKKTEYIYNIPLRVEKGFEYLAEVRIMDKVRQKTIHTFVPFNTLSDFNRYNFIAQGHFMKNMVFNPVIRKNEYVNLLYSRKPIDSLYVSFYKPYSEIPYPPSMMLPEKVMTGKPDTIIAIRYTDTLPMMFPRPGIYFCRIGRDIDEGYSFFNFGPSFPSMTAPEEMIGPLAYLNNEDEMNTLRSGIKPKVALDNFWLGCGGNIDKARELIRIYYTRVLYSNYYFTSFKEGWRTERGMIYIIYGPPDKIYKSYNEESWGYRKPVVKSRWGARFDIKEEYLFFNFKRNENKFSENEYYLSRNETAVTYWDKAVLAWRKGIVFRLDNPSDF